jgi:hypothetical protein
MMTGGVLLIRVAVGGDGVFERRPALGLPERIMIIARRPAVGLFAGLR